MAGRKKAGRRKKGAAHHHHAGWLYNYEEELPLAEGVEMISKIITTLGERSEVKISGTLVKPPPRPYFIVRFEQAPHGEMKLKLGIEWEPDADYDESADGPPDIE